MRSRFPLWSLGGLILTASPVVAQQTAPAPVPTVAVPQAGAVPPLITVAPPVATPTPAATLPAAAPTPRATPRPRATPTATPTSRSTPSPRTTATPTPRATPTPAPAPAASAPTAVPTVTTVPVAVPTPPPTPPAAVEPQSSGWLFPGAIVQVLAALAGVLLARRRRRGIDVEDAPVAVEPDATVSPAPPAVPVARAWLAFDLQPRRAGVNLLTATLDARLVVRNEGDAPASDVRAEVRLLSARAGQEGELAALFAEPGRRPVAAPFALAPGEERVLDVLATLPRDAINVLTAGGRPMFVPVAAVDVRYASGDVRGQTAAAFAVGVEREGAAKLMPFWLDGPGRMFDAVAARPHALAVRS